MAKIPETYNIGSNEDITLERLLDIMLDMYRDIAIQLNKKPDLYQRTTDGQASDTFLSNGDLNLNTTTQKVEMLVDRTATTVTWKAL
jgi:hypothetical protein